MTTTQPTDILKAEHRVIEQVLSCLEKLAEASLQEGKLPGQAARDTINFFRDFADRCHHGKEESHLFPLLESKGFSREHGPTGVMLDEHRQGREHIRVMDGALAAASAGDPGALQDFVAHARAYAELLRQHIHKEDECLFPMANQALSNAEQQALLSAFVEVESDEMEEGLHEKYLQLADELARRYGVPPAAAETPEILAQAGCMHYGR